MKSLDGEMLNLLSSLEPKPKILGILHSAQFSSHEASNYAVLVQELISRVCNLLEKLTSPRDDVQLECVIARRRQSYQDFAHQLNRNELSIAVANGLSSSGSLKFLSYDPPDIVPAEDSAALLICDFISGHIAHTVRRDNSFTDSAKKLKGEGITLYKFDDSYLGKKKTVSEGKGDYSEAILCTLQAGEDRSEVMRLSKALFAKDQKRARHDWESLINKLDAWGSETNKAEFVKALASLDDALNELERANYSPSVKAAKYRLLAYTLAWTNHLGNSAESDRILVRLSNSTPQAETDPELFEAVLQAQIGRIEQAINDHRFNDAAEFANEHRRYLNAKVKESGGLNGFDHALIRAETIDLRCTALYAAKIGDSDTMRLVICGAKEQLERPREGPTSSTRDDLVRLLQVQAFAAEFLVDKAELKDAATSLIRLLEETSSPYAIALLARSSASLVFFGDRIDSAVITMLEEAACSASQRQAMHPSEITVREWLLLGHKAKRLSTQQKLQMFTSLDRWEQSLDLQSEVLKHQKRLARLVRQYVGGLAISDELSEAENSMAQRFLNAGLSEEASKLFAIRSATIY